MILNYIFRHFFFYKFIKLYYICLYLFILAFFFTRTLVKKFINFINLLYLISEEGGIPLFTKENKLRSIDRAHLTYFGAKDIGKLLFSDDRLNDLK